MWESRLSGSERGRRTTMSKDESTNAAATRDGERRKQKSPEPMGASCLLKGNPAMGANREGAAKAVGSPE